MLVQKRYAMDMVQEARDMQEDIEKRRRRIVHDIDIARFCRAGSERRGARGGAAR